MAGRNKDVISLKRYKRKGTWNIGTILFGVIFIYLVVTVLTYLTKDRIAVYEVREGSILKNTSFTCIALRDENLVYADQEGYVNYFVEAGQKVAVGNNVYTLSTNKIADTSSTESNDEVDLSTDEWNSILMKVQSFHENFRLQNFKDVRVLKEETTALLQSNTNQNRVTQLNTLLGEGSIDGLQVFQTQDDGIIEYSYDGYEGLSMEDLTEDEFSKEGYAQDRYLDIELILEDESGLKIPKSAVTEKEFYLVPEDYLTTGGASNNKGVLRQTKNKKGDSIVEFLDVNVCYRDVENSMVYLDPGDFQAGDVLVRPESTETFTLSKTGTLKGVYNVNKGYAVFKQVEILCESEEYYIIEEGNSYGLSNYDHIALDGASVRENDIVSQ